MAFLESCRARGLDVMLVYGELQASRQDGRLLTDKDREYLRSIKEDLIAEIKALTAGPRISFAALIEDRVLKEKLSTGVSFSPPGSSPGPIPSAGQG